MSWEFQDSGNWRLIYWQRHLGDERNRRIKAPLIDPIEIPFGVTSRVLAVGASYLQAPPTWNTAGYFYQYVNRVPLDDSLIFGPNLGAGSAAIDSAKRRIVLNTIELHIFRRLASDHFYRFEPMRWFPEITLGVWEYTGPEDEDIEESIDASIALSRVIERKTAQIDRKLDDLLDR